MNYDLLDSLLRENGLSRRQLAIRAGIPESTMSSMFARKSQYVSPDTIKKIADVLGVEPYIFMFTNESWKAIGFTFDNTPPPDASEKDNDLQVTLLHAFNSLNNTGKVKAVEILDILSRVPDFKKEG